MIRRLKLIGLISMLLLTACAGGTPTPTVTENASTMEPTAEPSPTAAPPVALTVCTASLPESLFPYGGARSTSKDALTELMQADLATLLSSLPNAGNGGLQVDAVSVQRGQTVLDARGELVTLKAGVTVRPSGCQGSDCSMTWDGETDLTMDQMTLSYELQMGWTWSDGTPVTAADSVFSFNLASDPLTPGLQWAESRTASYTAASERGIVWVGKPGFTTADLERLFWMPLPAHLFAEEADWQTVADDPAWSGTLPGFGSFRIMEWGEEAIRLERNSDALDTFTDGGSIDEITLRRIAEPADAAEALQSGECDVLDRSYHLENQNDLLGGLQAETDLQVIVGQSDSWMQLVFGIQPASYDDYYNPVYGDRPDIFGDVRTRQAIAACLDLGALQDAVYDGLADIWPSFVSLEESQLDGGGIVYDPAEAARLLEEAGWLDLDGDPATPLQASTIGNVPQGTSLRVNLHLDQSDLSATVAEVVQQSLAQCGIGVTPVSLTPNELYAPGPDGPLFGRQFDLALLAWAPMDEPDCALYESWRIPTPENQWIGTNIAGMADSAYDAACSDAALALPGGAADALRQAELTYQNTLPAIPLFSAPQIIVASAALCSLEGPQSETEFFSQLPYAVLGEACGE